MNYTEKELRIFEIEQELKRLKIKTGQLCDHEWEVIEISDKYYHITGHRYVDITETKEKGNFFFARNMVCVKCGECFIS